MRGGDFWTFNHPLYSVVCEASPDASCGAHSLQTVCSACGWRCFWTKSADVFLLPARRVCDPHVNTQNRSVSFLGWTYLHNNEFVVLWLWNVEWSFLGPPNKSWKIKTAHKINKIIGTISNYADAMLVYQSSFNSTPSEAQVLMSGCNPRPSWLIWTASHIFI